MAAFSSLCRRCSLAHAVDSEGENGREGKNKGEDKGERVVNRNLNYNGNLKCYVLPNACGHPQSKSLGVGAEEQSRSSLLFQPNISQRGELPAI